MNFNLNIDLKTIYNKIKETVLKFNFQDLLTLVKNNKDIFSLSCLLVSLFSANYVMTKLKNRKKTDNISEIKKGKVFTIEGKVFLIKRRYS